MPCIHTCKLEVDIFFLHWDMIDQFFFPHWLPIQILHKSPYYSVHFIFLTSLQLRLIWGTRELRCSWGDSNTAPMTFAIESVQQRAAHWAAGIRWTPDLKSWFHKKYSHCILTPFINLSPLYKAAFSVHCSTTGHD